MEGMAAWESFLEEIKKVTLSFYGENLLSAVIFGSAARGDFQKGSDLDLLIILREEKGSMGKRIDEFMKIEWELRKSPKYKMLKDERLPYRIEPVILKLEEFGKHPPLLLDLVTDAKILVDKDDIFSREMDVLKNRLREVGANKVILEGGRWYWILKPDVKWGEIVVL